MSPDIAMEIWTRASEQEFGIALSVRPEDKVSITNLLSRVRKSSGNRELMNLIVVQPGSFPDQIWLVKKTVEL